MKVSKNSPSSHEDGKSKSGASTESNSLLRFLSVNTSIAVTTALYLCSMRSASASLTCATRALSGCNAMVNQRCLSKISSFVDKCRFVARPNAP